MGTLMKSHAAFFTLSKLNCLVFPSSNPLFSFFFFFLFINNKELLWLNLTTNPNNGLNLCRFCYPLVLSELSSLIFLSTLWSHGKASQSPQVTLVDSHEAHISAPTLASLLNPNFPKYERCLSSCVASSQFL